MSLLSPYTDEEIVRWTIEAQAALAAIDGELPDEGYRGWLPEKRPYMLDKARNAIVLFGTDGKWHPMKAAKNFRWNLVDDVPTRVIGDIAEPAQPE